MISLIDHSRAAITFSPQFDVPENHVEDGVHCLLLLGVSLVPTSRDVLTVLEVEPWMPRINVVGPGLRLGRVGAG